MTEKVKQYLKEFWAAARLGWVFLVLGFGLYFIHSSGNDLLKNQLGVLSWKLVVVSTGIALAHVTRRQIFNYVDLSEAAKGPDRNNVVLAMAIFYASVILALASGL